MTYDPAGPLTMAPPDAHGADRADRLRQLGIGARFPDARFDDFARKVAEILGAPFTMVNFIDEDYQYFAGMWVQPAPSTGEQAPLTAAPSDNAARTVGREHGYCPHVIHRTKALVLEDICDYPRFSGDVIVDEMGARSYLGAPLIDRTGTALGTVCALDLEPRPWGRPGLHTIKDMAADMIGQLHSREGFVMEQRSA